MNAKTSVITTTLATFALVLGCNGSRNETAITATGTIEVTESDVASTIPGRVVEVLVEEGDHVEKGLVVARLDASKLKVQLAQAVANLDAAISAEAQARETLDLERERVTETIAQAKSATNVAESRVRQAEVGAELQATQVDRQVELAERVLELSRTRLRQSQIARDLQAGQEAGQVAQAEASLAAAAAQVEKSETGARREEIAIAQANLDAATERLTNALTNRNRSRELFGNGALSQQAFDSAEYTYRTALAQHAAAMNQLQLAQDAVRKEDKALAYAQRDLATANVALAKTLAYQTQVREQDVSSAFSAVQQAEVSLALARANALQNRLRQDDIVAAKAGVAMSKSNERLAATGSRQVRVRQEALKLAVAQRKAAEETIRLIEEQIADTEIRAPFSGTVTHKVVETGEVVSPGAPIVTLANLSTATLTLYVSGNDLSRVRLGQRVQVRVDGDTRTFDGTVSYISPSAEFTPRNIQTRDERVKLVYAVKVTLPNPENVFKPGVPADAVINGSDS
jgi:multidrug resistance efflux pump